jgi:predicted HTH transcriptional regulator
MQESDDLEFKAFKCDLLLKHPGTWLVFIFILSSEIIQKQICSFLNKGVLSKQKLDSSGTIIIGISQDQKLQKPVVCGFKCS